MQTISVQAILSAKDKGYSAAMENAAQMASKLEKNTDRASSSISDIAKGTIAGKAVIAMFNKITAAVGSAISRLDTLNNYPKVMTSLGYSAEDAQRSIDRLSSGIEGLPTTLDSIVGSAQTLTASLGDLDKGTKTAIALNDMFLAGGQGAEAASRALTQYNQILAKGKVDQQSWNTLVEVAPGQMNQLAKSLLGATANQKDLYQALSDGVISIDKVNKAVINLDQQGGEGFQSFAEQARAATGGIGTALTNIQSAITKGVANVMSAVDQAAQAAGLPGISEALEGVKKAINDFFAVAAKVASGITSVVAPALKFLGENINTVMLGVGALVGGFTALKIVNSVRTWITNLKNASSSAADTCLKYKDALDKYSTSAEASSRSEKLRREEVTAAKAADILAKKATESLGKAKKLETKAQELRTKAQKAGANSSKYLASADKVSTLATKAKAEADKNAKKAQDAATMSKKKGVQASEAQAAAETLSNTQITLKKMLLGVLSGKVKIATAVQTAWNSALSSCSIGLVIKLVTALITVVSALSTALGAQTEEAKKAKEAHEEFMSSAKESTDAVKKNADEVKYQAEAFEKQAETTNGLVREIERLSSIENKSKEDKQNLSTAVNQLNGRVEDLNLSYDEENDNLSLSTKLIKQKVDQSLKLAKIEAIQNAYNGALEEELDIRADQDTLNEKYVKSLDIIKTLKEKGIKITYDELKALSEEASALGTNITGIIGYKEELEKQYKEGTDALAQNAELQKQYADDIATYQEEASQREIEAQNFVTNALAAAITEKAALLEQSLANQSATLDMLSQKNQETVASLNDTWKSYVDQATNMFDVLTDKTDMTVQNMIDNMAENQRVIRQWGDNMQALRNRFAELGLDTAVLEQFQSMGPEGAAYVAQAAALIGTESEGQLAQLASTFSQGGETAYNALGDSMSQSAAANMDKVKNLVTDMGASLSDAVAATNWMEMSADIVSGLAEGLEADEEAIEAAKALAQDTYKSSALEFEINSPSKVFEEQGKYNVEGLAQGMTKNNKTSSNAAKSIAEEVISSMKTILAKMEEVGSYAMQGFKNGLASMSSSVISTAQSIASQVASTIEKALQIGSPSKLLKKYGAWAGEGLAIGLESAKRMVTNASEMLSEATAGISINGIGFDGLSNFAAAGGGELGAEYSYYGSAQYVIEVPVMLDGKEIARTTAPYTQAELDRRAVRNARKNGYV